MFHFENGFYKYKKSYKSEESFLEFYSHDKIETNPILYLFLNKREFTIAIGCYPDYLGKDPQVHKKSTDEEEIDVLVFADAVVELKIQNRRPRRRKPLECLEQNRDCQIRILLPMISMRNNKEILAVDEHTHYVVLHNLASIQCLIPVLHPWGLAFMLIHPVDFDNALLTRFLLALLSLHPDQTSFLPMLHPMLESHLHRLCWNTSTKHDIQIFSFTIQDPNLYPKKT